MMKKAAVVLCSMFVMSSLSFAGMHGTDKGVKCHMPDCAVTDCKGECKMPKMSKEERTAKMEAMKKEHAEFQQKLDKLVEKYNKASDKKKDGVKQEIKALLATQTDKEVAMKKEMLAVQKDRIAKFEKEIADIEADKDAYLNKKTDFVVSAEGQKKMQEMKEKMKKIDKSFKKKGGDKGGMPMPPPPME